MKYVAIRKAPNESLYMDKYFFSRFADADLNTYGYQKIGLLDEEFENVSVKDFVIDKATGKICFSSETQEDRIARETKLKELPILQSELDKLSQDMIQMQCGAVFEDKDYRILRFRELHNMIREIQGKEPRIYQ